MDVVMGVVESVVGESVSGEVMVVGASVKGAPILVVGHGEFGMGVEGCLI